MDDGGGAFPNHWGLSVSASADESLEKVSPVPAGRRSNRESWLAHLDEGEEDNLPLGASARVGSSGLPRKESPRPPTLEQPGGTGQPSSSSSSSSGRRGVMKSLNMPRAPFQKRSIRFDPDIGDDDDAEVGMTAQRSTGGASYPKSFDIVSEPSIAMSGKGSLVVAEPPIAMSGKGSLEIMDARSITFEVGDRVESIHGFHDDSDPPVWIKKGRVGTIGEIDGDGDLMIAFDGFKSYEWVGRTKAKKNIVVQTTAQGAIINEKGLRNSGRQGFAPRPDRRRSIHQSVKRTGKAKLMDKVGSILQFAALSCVAAGIGKAFTIWFPAPHVIEGDMMMEPEILEDCAGLIAPTYWVIFTAALAPLVTSIAFGPPRPGVAPPPWWKVVLRNVIRFAMFGKFYLQMVSDAGKVWLYMSKMQEFDFFTEHWWKHLHHCFLLFCSSSNVPSAMAATGIAELYTGHAAWVKAHREDAYYMEEETDEGAELLMKEQGIVFGLYEFTARSTYVNLVFLFMFPYLLPACALFFFYTLPLIWSLILLACILGLVIPAFCGLRGHRGARSAEIAQQCQDTSFEVQKKALEAAWSRTNHKMPEGRENVMVKYLDEATSMILTGAPKSSWIKYFYLPLVVGVVPVALVTVAARLYSLGFSEYTYALSRTLTEKNSGDFLIGLANKICGRTELRYYGCPRLDDILFGKNSTTF